MSVVERERAPEVTREVTEADVLERAADLLEEFGWITEEVAVDSSGLAVAEDDPAAAAFCAGGAYCRAHEDLGLGRLDWDNIPSFGLHPKHIQFWNDYPGRTKAEVVSALRTAAEKARQA